MIIGITGGSGCGKTTALRAFEHLGGKVLDCDEIYHNLLKTEDKLLEKIEKRFPGTVESRTLDRPKLAQIVFKDQAALKDLNAITHCFVKQYVEGVLAEEKGHVAIDAAGLFESGLNTLCDATVAVTAPEEERVRRLTQRDGITEEKALLRIRAQRPQEEFVGLCDYHLSNEGTREEFYQKCLAFFGKLGIM